MSLVVIPQQFVNQNWQAIAPFIEKSLLYDGCNEATKLYDIDHVRMYLVCGQWIAIASVEKEIIHGCAAISIVDYPLHRVAYVCAVGGAGTKILYDKATCKQLIDILKQYGVTLIQASARKSMKRLLSRIGFIDNNSTMELLIKDDSTWADQAGLAQQPQP